MNSQCAPLCSVREGQLMQKVFTNLVLIYFIITFLLFKTYDALPDLAVVLCDDSVRSVWRWCEEMSRCVTAGLNVVCKWSTGLTHSLQQTQKPQNTMKLVMIMQPCQQLWNVIIYIKPAFNHLTFPQTHHRLRVWLFLMNIKEFINIKWWDLF